LEETICFILAYWGTELVLTIFIDENAIVEINLNWSQILLGKKSKFTIIQLILPRFSQSMCSVRFNFFRNFS